MRSMILALALGCLSIACASRSRPPAPESTPPAEGAGEPAPTHSDETHEAALEAAHKAISAGQIEVARGLVDPIIAHYERAHVEPHMRNFSARSMPEGIFYLLQAANEESGDARVLSPIWSEAYFLRGYLCVEEKDLAGGERWIKRALDLSPQNARYLAELGHIYQSRRDWARAMATFEAAVTGADLSPPHLQISDKTRAMRGIGFTLIETGEFAAATAIYEECLALDPDDAAAQRELAYIRQELAKQGGGDERPNHP